MLCSVLRLHSLTDLYRQVVERMEEKLEAAFGDQKRIFLIIFQRFIMILSEHLVKCDTDGRDYNTDWYRWTIGRLQQVFLTVRDRNQLIKFNILIDLLKLIKLKFRFLFHLHLASRASAQIFEHSGESSLHPG